MPNFDRPDSSKQRVHSTVEPVGLPEFVSRQVVQARRYFLDLRPPEDTELSVVCGGCERVSPDYRIERSGFPFFCVELVVEGEGEVELNGRRSPLAPGRVFCYGPRTRHRIWTDPARPMLKYYVDFAGNRAVPVLEEAGLSAGECCRVTPVEEIADLFEGLQRDAASEHAVVGALCAGWLRLILLKIRERSLPARQGEAGAFETFRRARVLFEKNALHWRSAGQAADACGLAQETLNRLFRRFAHTTPYQFLVRRKMSRAAELLLDAGLRVKDVAAELGFADPAHFTRTFKRLYGVAPENFVRDVQGTIPGKDRAARERRASF
jgi:AraC-like DNA-binding protein